MYMKELTKITILINGTCSVKEAFKPDGENNYLCHNKKEVCLDVKDLVHFH